MKRVLIAAMIIAALVTAQCSEPVQTQEPTPSPEPTATSTPEPTATPTPEPTATPTPEPTATPTPEPTATPTPEPTATPTPEPTATPTPEPTATPTPEPTATPTPEPTATPTPEPTAETLTNDAKGANLLAIAVAPVPSDIPEYDRSEWRHWIDEDGDCQDARQEVLISESLVEVTFESEKLCRVATGEWYGAFTGTYVEVPGDLDIDHLVPLKNAHESGGWSWDSSMKEAYANHLGDPNHLIAVTSGANRSKGARGPDEWRPPDGSYWCQYATDWTEVKMEWGLTMTQGEAEVVMDMLDTCKEPVPVEARTTEGIPTPSSELEEKRPVYGSCEEAEAAGESRVQGSIGPGRGFPSEVVPRVRDGDGDGVVCEE